MGLINATAIGFGGILAAAFAKLLADEVKDWLPALTERIVLRAVLMMPVEQQKRFAEEWRADLCDVPGGMSKLLVAYGFYISSIKIKAISISWRSVKRKLKVKKTMQIAAASMAIVTVAFGNVSLDTDLPGNILVVGGISGAKRHADNPGNNPLGPELGKLSAGAAFLYAPSVLEQLQGDSRAEGSVGLIGF